MGMRPTEAMDADLNVTNVATGATWAFPPTMLMAASNDQTDILELVKWTALYLKTQARTHQSCGVLGAAPHLCASHQHPEASET